MHLSERDDVLVLLNLAMVSFEILRNMKTPILTIIFLSIFSLTCFGQDSITAEDVLRNYIEALGGEEKIKAVQSIEIHSLRPI